MKKLLTLLLTLFMVFTLVGCNSKQDTPIVQKPEKQEEVVEPVQEEIVGGYVDVEDGTLTDELKDIFNKALEGLTGSTYKPQELVATQVVAGTNYKFLANGTKTTNPITKGTYYIYIYEDLQGNVELKDIEVIEEKQEEVKTQDVTQMYFWIVFYDQYGNELQRTAEKYGTIPSFKGTLPEGFIKWKYKKTGKDVTTFLPIITNTYFIAEQITSSKPVKAPTYHIEYLDEAGFIFSGEHENGYPTIHTYGKNTILKSAFKYGYEFEGWYEDYECDGDPITVLKAKDYTDDIFLYAKWKQITTTVNCYVYDNTASTEKEYVPLKNVKIMYDVENGGTYFGTTSEYGFAQLEVPSYKKGYFKVSTPGYETIVLDPVTYGDKQIANEYFWMDRSVATISLISKHGHFKGITTAQDNVDSINVYVGQYFSANCNGYIYVADDKFGTNVKVYQFVADEGYAFSSFNPTIPYTKVYKSFKIIAKTNKPGAYNIVVEDDGHGTASADSTSAAPGANVTLSATPNDGYAFKQWQIIRGLNTGDITDNTFTMPSNEVKVKALFEREYTVEVEANGHGTASADVEKGVSGKEVNLTITPDEGYEADQITVVRGGVTVVDKKFNIGTADVKIRVTFKAIVPSTYGIIVEDDGYGTAKAQVESVDVTSAAPGAVIALTATPNDGYTFKEWADVRGNAGDFQKDTASTKLTMPSNDIKVKATFERVYNITLQTNEHGTAVAKVGEKEVTTAPADAEVTLTTEPAEGYQFKTWKVVSGDVSVTENKFTMPKSNVTVMAVFEEIPETKTVADILPTEFPNEDFDKLFYDDELPSNPWVKNENFVSCVLDYSTSQDVALINKDNLMDFIGCDLNEKLVKGDNENTWVCTNTYGTFTFVVEDGAFTQITFSDNVGSSDYERFDGTYTAPTAINTVSDVLKTAGKNAPSNTEYWYGANIGNKNTCGINSDSLEFKGTSGQILIPVSASVTVAGDNYTYSTEAGLITFKMTNKVLKSIAVSNFKEGNVVLNDEYAIKIVEDVIKTAAGDFSKGTESWYYNGYPCKAAGGQLLIDCNGGSNYYVLTVLERRVALEGDNWTCIANDGKGKITFNMTEGALTSITVSGCEGDYAVLNGTYTAPIDKASYTMKKQDTWFSAFSGTTTDKTKIIDITFCKELPQGVSAENPVNLTDDSENGKVKGYIVESGDNYKIYIVGDYIFGNSVCWNMFSGFSNLKTLDFGNFDTSNVTVMFNMFNGCSSLTFLDLSSFDTSETSNMQSMFTGCSKLESITFGTKFNTLKVTSMVSMFNGCSALKSLNLSGFDTSVVTKMNSMFQGCSALKSLDLSKFNTAKVEGMASMFKGCSVLESLDLSKFVTLAVTDMNGMFTDCSKLESITFGSNFDTSKVTNMNGMFNGCSALKSLDLSKFVTSAVINMDAMFKNCSTLGSLDLSKFYTSAVAKMSNMFNGCSGLTSLDLSDFTVGDETIVDDMFKDCSKLTSVKINNKNDKIDNALGDGWNYNDVTKTYEAAPTPVVKGAGLYKDSVQIKTWDELKTEYPNAFTDEGATITGYDDGDPASYFKDLEGELVIDSSITKLDSGAFSGCADLTFTIPSSVINIGNGAFSETSITSATISKDIAYGRSVYFMCSNLKNVVIEDGVKSIPFGMFLMCNELNSIEIPSSVESIEANAFLGCTNLSSISFAGTKEQWNNVSKGDSWNGGVPATEVCCSDGDVPLNN